MEAAKNEKVFESYLKSKSDSSAPMANGLNPDIKSNSAESEILCSPDEKLSDLLSGDPLKKRSEMNGGALNSSEKEGKDTYQPILGLTEEYDEKE